MVRVPPGYHRRAGGWPGWVVPAGTQVARKVLPSSVHPAVYRTPVQVPIGPYGFAQGTISAGGGCILVAGPQGYGVAWNLAQIALNTSTGAADTATAAVFAQPYGVPAEQWQVAQSYAAGGDQLGLSGIKIVTGEVIYVVWSAAHPGDVANFVLSGIQTVKRSVSIGPGLGGMPPPPPGYAPPDLPGVAAGSTNVFRGRLVIVSGPAGTITGLFVYAAGTTPALGNPPIFWATSSAADPYGNPLPSTVGVAGVGTFRAGFTVIDPTGIYVYSGTPAAGNLIAAIAPAAGNDSLTNAHPQGLFGRQVTISSISSPPAPFAGAAILYFDSLSRLRYETPAGVDLVMDRSIIDNTNFTMTTQTLPTVMSSGLAYKAGEAQIGSEYEIEIDGTITTATTVNTSMPVYNTSLFVDGAGVGANNVTFGTTFLASLLTVAYCVRWRVLITTLGVSGQCKIIADGGASIQFNNGVQFNLGNLSPVRTAPGGGGGQGSTPINQVSVAMPFDTTQNHTIAIYNNWSSTLSSGHSAITYRTKLTRRN